jgi:Holliday junction resolvase RusA-like endonuclease
LTDPIRIVIPMATPSLNETQRMHWGRRSREGKQWLAMVALLCRDVPRATGRRHVTIERFGVRELDKDNAYGGAKVLVDCLKKLGIIINDDAANLDLEVVQRRCKWGESRTEIAITDHPSFSCMFPDRAK